MSTANDPAPAAAPQVVHLKVLSPSAELGGGPLHFADLPVGTTVAALKAKIRDAVATNPSVERQRLIYRGRVVATPTDTMLDVFGSDALRESPQQTMHLVVRDPSASDAAGAQLRPRSVPPNPFRAGTTLPDPPVNPFRQGFPRPPRPQTQPPQTQQPQPQQLPLPGQLHRPQPANPFQHFHPPQQPPPFPAFNVGQPQQPPPFGVHPPPQHFPAYNPFVAPQGLFQQHFQHQAALIQAMNQAVAQQQQMMNQPPPASDSTHADRPNTTTGSNPTDQPNAVVNEENRPTGPDRPSEAASAGSREASAPQENAQRPTESEAAGTRPDAVNIARARSTAPSRNASTNGQQPVQPQPVRTDFTRIVAPNGDQIQMTVNRNNGQVPQFSWPAQVPMPNGPAGMPQGPHIGMHGMNPRPIGTPNGIPAGFPVPPHHFNRSPAPGQQMRAPGAAHGTHNATPNFLLPNLLSNIGQSLFQQNQAVPPSQFEQRYPQSPNPNVPHLYLVSQSDGQPYCIVSSPAHGTYTGSVPPSLLTQHHAPSNLFQSAASNVASLHDLTDELRFRAQNVSNSLNHRVVTHQPTATHAQGAAAPNPDQPNAQPGPAAPAQDQDQDQNQQPAPVNAAPNAPAAQEDDIFRVILPILGHVWLFIRVFGIMYLFGGGLSWQRMLLIASSVVLAYLFNLGVFGTRVDHLRRYLDELLGLRQGELNGPVGVQRPANPERRGAGEEAAQGQAAERPRTPTVQEAATRIMRQREEERERGRGVFRRHMRAVERAVALFVASLWPGLGERYVAARERQDREERERVEQEERRSQEELVQRAQLARRMLEEPEKKQEGGESSEKGKEKAAEGGKAAEEEKTSEEQPPMAEPANGYVGKGKERANEEPASENSVPEKTVTENASEGTAGAGSTEEN